MAQSEIIKQLRGLGYSELSTTANKINRRSVFHWLSYLALVDPVAPSKLGRGRRNMDRVETLPDENMPYANLICCQSTTV